MRRLLVLRLGPVLLLSLLLVAGCSRTPNLARLSGLSSDLSSVQLRLSGGATANDSDKRWAFDVLSAAKPVKGEPPFDFTFGYSFILEVETKGKQTIFIRGRSDVSGGKVYLACKVKERISYFSAPLADLVGPFPRILPVDGISVRLPNDDAVRLQSFLSGPGPQAVGMHRGADWTEVLVRAGRQASAGWRVIPIRTDMQRSVVTVEAKTFGPSSRVEGAPSEPTLGFEVPGYVDVKIILDGNPLNVHWVDGR